MEQEIRLYNPEPGGWERKESSEAMRKILPVMLDLAPETALNLVMVLLSHCTQDMDSKELETWFFNFKLMRVDYKHYLENKDR